MLFILLLVLTACSLSAASLSDVTVTFENADETYEAGEFVPYIVTLKDDRDNYLTVDEVYLYINMEGMNHPMEGTMEEMESGVYELPLPLSMAGEWYVVVTVKQGEEEREETFTVYGEGERVMEYMKGYNHDEK